MNEDKPRREVGCCAHPTEGTTEGPGSQFHPETEEPEPELNQDLVHSFGKQPSAPPGAEQGTATRALGEHARGAVQAAQASGIPWAGLRPRLQSEDASEACLPTLLPQGPQGPRGQRTAVQRLMQAAPLALSEHYSEVQLALQGTRACTPHSHTLSHAHAPGLPTPVALQAPQSANHLCPRQVGGPVPPPHTWGSPSMLCSQDQGSLLPPGPRQPGSSGILGTALPTLSRQASLVWGNHQKT